jgi:hypothetical protein
LNECGPHLHGARQSVYIRKIENMLASVLRDRARETQTSLAPLAPLPLLAPLGSLSGWAGRITLRAEMIIGPK